MTASSAKHTNAVTLPSVKTTPGYKRVADLIEAEIFAGRLPVGELLPTEHEMSKQLGVNRSTVREGIRALENSGLLRRVGGKRLEVVVPESASVARANTRALGMRAVSFKQLWDVQMQLEPFSARRAAENSNADAKERLGININALEEHLAEDAVIIRNDIEFHEIIAELADNEALSMALAPVTALIFSATVQLYKAVPAARHRLLGAHKAIGEAVIDGDADGAERWMTRHIQDFKRGYEIGNLDMDAPIKPVFHDT